MKRTNFVVFADVNRSSMFANCGPRLLVLPRAGEVDRSFDLVNEPWQAPVAGVRRIELELLEEALELDVLCTQPLVLFADIVAALEAVRRPALAVGRCRVGRTSGGVGPTRPPRGGHGTPWGSGFGVEIPESRREARGEAGDGAATAADGQAVRLETRAVALARSTHVGITSQ